MEVMFRPLSLLRPSGALVMCLENDEVDRCTFHGDDFVVVDFHAGESAEFDVGLAVEVDVERFGGEHGGGVFGEGIERCEIDMLVDGNKGLGVGLGFGNGDIGERVLSVQRQRGVEGVDGRVVFAVASNHALQFQLDTLFIRFGYFLRRDLEG
jgi:hypothetical protein